MLQHVASQRAVTHTQALAGAYGAGLALWAAVTGDAALAALRRDRAGRRRARGRRRRSAGRTESARRRARRRPPRSSSAAGPAWAAALELALMLKEISRIPAEGVETREGATSAMFGLHPGHLMVSLDPAGDPLGDEALRLCAAAGATTLRLPGAPSADARLAPITTLPAAAALSAGLALAAGHDVDQPDLDRRLLRDRAERDVSVGLGVIGCGSVFWTPYMSLIERLARPGPRRGHGRLRRRPGQAPRGRRAARPRRPTCRTTSPSASTPTSTSCSCSRA